MPNTIKYGELSMKGNHPAQAKLTLRSPLFLPHPTPGILHTNVLKNLTNYVWTVLQVFVLESWIAQV